MKKQREFLAVTVEGENNADLWWSNVRAAYPRLAAYLERDNQAVVTREVWDALASLPGFADGPSYALTDCGNQGPKWNQVVNSRHRLFEEAS